MPNALAMDFPGLNLPSLSDIAAIGAGSTSMQDSDTVNDVVPETCSEERLARYPSGWPAALDWGIYWYGPNDEFKKAEPRQQVKLVDPTSWFEQGDGYANSTERWNKTFYDPSRNTVLYFHGWSGDGAWSTKDCKRVTSKCNPNLCPKGGVHELAKPWIEKGWNVGFFYWDQFADEPCMRDAEQKIWFDREGNGLRWASYSPRNNTFQWKQYQGEAMSVIDLCATAVKEAMGDFFGGGTVRFVGRSIGAQLAVGCAAKLHEEQHVAAPQRITLLDPFFTTQEFTFLGTVVRCGRVVSSTGVGAFAQQATANYVKMLWETKRVATEVYSSAGSTSGLDSQAAIDMATYSVQVAYKPSWCDGEDSDLKCEHQAVFPLYFLSFGLPPPPLVQAVTSPGRLLDKPAVTCAVPSASCTDAELRALLEEHILLMQSQTSASWDQVDGTDTFAVGDDTFALTSGTMLNTITPDPAIEEEVAQSNAIEQRQWGMSRGFRLGSESGMSTKQLDFVVQIAGCILALPLMAFLTYRLISLASQKACASSTDEDEEGSEEEEEEEDGESDLEGSMKQSPLMEDH